MSDKLCGDPARALVSYLIEVSEIRRYAVAAVPADDEVRVAVVAALESAIHWLVNNSARACGVDVGDRQSEMNFEPIRDLVHGLVYEPAEDARKEYTRLARAAMNETLRTLEAQRDEINEQISALHAAMIDHDISCGA